MSIEAKLAKVDKAFTNFLAMRDAVAKAGKELEKECGEYYDAVDEEYQERRDAFELAGVSFDNVPEGKWREKDWRMGVLYELMHEFMPTVEDSEVETLWSKSSWNEATREFKKMISQALRRVAELRMASKDVPPPIEEGED
jgi:hypothetical protein